MSRYCHFNLVNELVQKYLFDGLLKAPVLLQKKYWTFWHKLML